MGMGMAVVIVLTIPIPMPMSMCVGAGAPSTMRVPMPTTGAAAMLLVVVVVVIPPRDRPHWHSTGNVATPLLVALHLHLYGYYLAACGLQRSLCQAEHTLPVPAPRYMNVHTPHHCRPVMLPQVSLINASDIGQPPNACQCLPPPILHPLRAPGEQGAGRRG